MIYLYCCSVSNPPPAAATAAGAAVNLQEKLSHVAATVGKIGATVAATCFVALLIKWCVINRGFPLDKINQNGPVQVCKADILDCT